MKRADSEESILENFRTEHVHILSRDKNEYEELRDALSLIMDDEKWSRWKHNYGKADPPPDFVSEELGCMMEVMSIDDHAFQDDGKIINKTRAAESEMYGVLKSPFNFDGDFQLTVIRSSGLPYYEDHNYVRYVSNARRVIDKHKEKITLYRNNHPGCSRLIFFIFDQSTPYLWTHYTKRDRAPGDVTVGKIHRYFHDRNILDCFNDKRIDYIIWYAPYKVYVPQGGKEVQYCPAVIMSGKNHCVGFKYPKSKMMSAEM